MNPRLPRLVLRLWPKSHRERFGDDLVETWRLMRRDAKARGGRRAEWSYLLREARDFLRWSRAGHSGRGASASGRWGRDAVAGWRRWRHHPARVTTAVVLLSSALAVALTAWLLADAVLWRPLPFRDPERLVAVWERFGPAGAVDAGRVTGGRFSDWVEHTTAVEELAAFGAAGFQWDRHGEVMTVRGVRVSGNFFRLLGLQPTAGRLLDPADQAPEAPRVVVLSHAFWRRHFAASPSAIGQSLRLSGTPYTIVGVAPDTWLPSWPVNPATIQLDPDQRQMWVPLPPASTLAANHRSHLFGVLGRLAPGQSVASATAALEARAGAGLPDAHGAVVRSLRDQMTGQARMPLIVLLAAAVCLLLVAVLNLATLELAACEARVQEFRVRAALGASGSALRRQLLFELAPVVAVSMLLAAVGARAFFTVASGPLGERVPLLTAPGLTPSGLVGLAVAGLVVLALLTTWPVRRLTGATVGAMSGGRVAAGPGAFRALLVGQVTGAVALGVVAAVLVQAFVETTGRDPGFDPQAVQVLELSLPRDQYDAPERIVAFERRLHETLGAAFGAGRVSVSHDHPFEANWLDVVGLLGDAGPREDVRAQAQLRIVSPEYVDMIGGRLLEGRGFDPLLDVGDAGQVLVNESFVRRHGAGLGRRLSLSSPVGTWGPTVPATFDVIGVLADERFLGLDGPSEPAVYVSTRQFPQVDLSVLVRTGAGAPAADLRTLVRQVEPRASQGRLAALTTLEAGQRAPRTWLTTLVSGFATASLVLAGIGLTGLLLLSVASRQQELAVRLALGASPGSIVRSVQWEALVPAAIGSGLGLGLAWLLAGTLRARLDGVRPLDVATLAGVLTLMLGVALLASVWPAQRAARIDPARAFRE